MMLCNTNYILYFSYITYDPNCNAEFEKYKIIITKKNFTIHARDNGDAVKRKQHLK